MKKIKLTQGKCAIVDDEDFETLSKYKWHAQYKPKNDCFYAARSIYRPGKIRKLHMHRVVTCAPLGSVVDHINHNGLDNRKSNLRVCSGAENQRNRKRQRNQKNKYIGVQKDPKGYRARIWSKGRSLELGVFDTAKKAAIVRDMKALELRGPFAHLNFPSGQGPL